MGTRPASGRTAGSARSAGGRAAGTRPPVRSSRATPGKAPRSAGSAGSDRSARSDRPGRADASTRAAASAKRADRRALQQVDGPRGVRGGDAAEARRARNRRRRLIWGLTTTVLLVGVLFVAVLPIRPLLGQRDVTEREEAELRELQADRERVRRETERLATDEEIEKQAREVGYVLPGEEAVNILPPPTDPIGLPGSWPFTGVERALGVR